LTFPHFNFNARSARPPQGPPLAGYPPVLRRVFFWYDSLSDWQRVQYAATAILFLLACGGYLLGLGSAVVLARVDSEQPTLAAQVVATEVPTVEPSATPLEVVPTAVPTSTRAPTATPLPPTPVPTHTPFTAPVIDEPPAAPRLVPAAPVAPAVVAPRATPTTAARPRNIESTPAVSIPTPITRIVRTAAPAVVEATAPPAPVREVPAAPTTGRAQPAVTSAPAAPAAPTALLKPSGPTAAPTRPPAAATAQPAQSTAVLQPQQTPGKTPASR
jgi:hypothetical protein